MIHKRTIRIMLNLPRDLADALEREATANCLRPSQIVRAWLAKRLRERAREAEAARGR